MEEEGSAHFVKGIEMGAFEDHDIISSSIYISTTNDFNIKKKREKKISWCSWSPQLTHK